MNPAGGLSTGLPLTTSSANVGSLRYNSAIASSWGLLLIICSPRAIGAQQLAGDPEGDGAAAGGAAASRVRGADRVKSLASDIPRGIKASQTGIDS